MATIGAGERAVYVSGPPGCGKSHSIGAYEAYLAGRGVQCVRTRPSRVNELINAFEIATGPIILEEADVIFRSKAMFEILKQATDKSTSDWFTRSYRVKGEVEEVMINLNRPVIVSTNMDLSSPAGWAPELLNDRAALFDRSAPIVIPDDPKALWEWAVYLALTSHLTRDITIRNRKGGKSLTQPNSLAIQAQALEWFTANINRMAVISARSLQRAAQVIGRHHRGDMPCAIMKTELEAMLLPRSRAKPIRVEQEDWAELLKTTPKKSV